MINKKLSYDGEFHRTNVDQKTIRAKTEEEMLCYFICLHQRFFYILRLVFCFYFGKMWVFSDRILK